MCVPNKAKIECCTETALCCINAIKYYLFKDIKLLTIKTIKLTIEICLNLAAKFYIVGYFDFALKTTMMETSSTSYTWRIPFASRRNTTNWWLLKALAEKMLGKVSLPQRVCYVRYVVFHR